ncbi:hypothetical protein M378DRAFT_170500, partial [Amanita muscaria Koide BX008]
MGGNKDQGVTVPAAQFFPHCKSQARRVGMRKYTHKVNQRLSPLMSLETLEGIERHSTRAIKAEICIIYLRGRCRYGLACKRIHPVDKSPFLKLLGETVTINDRHSTGNSVLRSCSLATGTLTRSKSSQMDGSCALHAGPQSVGITESRKENLGCSKMNEDGPPPAHGSNVDIRSSGPDAPWWNVHSEKQGWICESALPSGGLTWNAETGDATPQDWSAEPDGWGEATPQDWSALPSDGPNWNSETGGWGEATPQDWINESSESSVSGLSVLNVDPDHRIPYPSEKNLNKCETWLKSLPKASKHLLHGGRLFDFKR